MMKIYASPLKSVFLKRIPMRSASTMSGTDGVQSTAHHFPTCVVRKIGSVI